MNSHLDADIDLHSDNNFAFIQDAKGDIKAGGYKLDTQFTKGGAMTSGHINKQSGGNSVINSALKDLAVPAGLFYLQQNFKTISKPYQSANQINKNLKKSKSSKSSYETDFVISENMFDKLLAMVDPTEKKVVDIKTRKKTNSRNKKTRKNRKNRKN